MFLSVIGQLLDHCHLKCHRTLMLLSVYVNHKLSDLGKQSYVPSPLGSHLLNLTLNVRGSLVKPCIGRRQRKSERWCTMLSTRMLFAETLEETAPFVMCSIPGNLPHKSFTQYHKCIYIHFSQESNL